MRILILTPSLPFPPIWGFGIRVYEFVRLLAQRHQVSLLTYAEPGEEDKIAGVEKVGVTVHAVVRTPETERSKRRAQLRSTFSRTSYQRRSLHSDAMQRKLDELMKRESFDVVQVESSQLAGFTFDPRRVQVLDEHNIEYELLQRMCRTEGSATRRGYNWLEFLKFRREEVAAWKSATGVITTSAREERIINALAPGVPTMVAPNAVNVEYFRPSDEPKDAGDLVMTGLMHYRPNTDGAAYFVNEIFPNILASRPNTIFYIVGAGATPEVKRLASRNVVVTDTVPDVRPYAYKSAVFVVPLRMGGGTRLKVLEGLSMKKAVVSTSVGSEGIDVTPGKHLLLEDDPRRFAEAVLQLLGDRDMRLRLGQEGRTLVEQQYRWETVVERLEAYYERLLSSSAHTRTGGS